MAAALRLGDLFNELAQADKPMDEWEKVSKLLTFLEAFPSGDFGACASRIEDASNTRGITFEDAVSWIAQRQTILDDRVTLADIVPRTRPIYKAATQTLDTVLPDAAAPMAPGGSSSVAPPVSETPATDYSHDHLVKAFIAATHRKNAEGKTPREKCPQTPGLHLRRVAAECRVDGCVTPSRSRLCEEHALQLVSRKAKFLPCSHSGTTRYAVYSEQQAQGSKPAWRGILIRDEEAHRKALGE